MKTEPVPLRGRAAIILFALLMSACATSFEALDAGLPKLVGRSVDEAIHYLGIPDGQYDVADRRVYVWSTDASYSYLAPQTTTSTGYVGRAPVQINSTTYSDVNVSLSCKIKLSTKDERVLNWQYQGNNGACMKYVNGLRPLTN